LRVLQFREFERLGGTGNTASGRAHSSRHQRRHRGAVASGAFREDLYYRINIFTITLPWRSAANPGSRRIFQRKFTAEHSRKIGRISSAAMDLFVRQQFPAMSASSKM